MTDRLKTALRVTFLLAVILALAGPFSAQNAPADPNQALTKHLKWRSIGPANMIGRISAFEALDGDFTNVLVAGAAGGVFKSVNAGTTWEPIFDKYGSSSIGDVKFFQKDPNIIWVGTGESCVRNSVSWGDGVYKSTDGGKTFVRMGLETTQTIGRIRTHPTDPNIVYVAASGHPWGYTGDRGLFKTTDGGKTWVKLAGGLPNDGKTGAVDLAMDPTNPDVLYVSFWQRLRQPWRFDSGGPNGGIFKTTDGGQTWTKLTQGLPAGDLGRIGVAISRSNPKVLMAVIEATFQPTRDIRTADNQTKPNPDFSDMTKLGTGIYRSVDGGATWQFMNRMNSRPFYYSHIFINPFEDKWVYFLTSNLNFSNDGGKTWTQIGGLHPDFHAMWLDPTNKNRFYVGQDGGASITYDNGKTWVFYDNLCLSQFYAVSADMRDPYYVYGGLQDNGTWGGPSMSREGMILTDFWFNIGGGDGFHTQNDPTDWRTVYCESQGGSALRVNVETRETRSIRPIQANVINFKDYYPDQPAAPGAKPGAKPAAKPPAAKPAGKPAAPGQKPSAKAEPVPSQEEAMMAMAGRQAGPFRFNWSTPILISPHNPRTVYFGGNHLFRSMDRGDKWMIISPDLTTNDKTKYAPDSPDVAAIEKAKHLPNKPSGGITRDVTGAETHCTIITISESPVIPGLIWVGTDDGNVQLTRNGGASWTNVRAAIANVPKGIWVSRVEASHFDPGTCYLTFDGHRSDDFHTYVFKTTDYGKTWTNIAGNLPASQPVYVIREDLKNKDLLFLGTEYGAHFSRDGGKSWSSLSLNLPVVPVHDLLIHPRDNDLIAATHGRGIWIMDDIVALRGATDNVLGQDGYLFETSQPGTRWLQVGRGGYGRGDLFFKGENPPSGAPIDFYLKAKPDKPATLDITDATGSLKTTYILDTVDVGISRVAWDLRFDPPAATVQGMVSTLKKQIEAALLRTDLTAEQKTTLQKAQAALEQFGTNFRKVAEIRRSVGPLLGGGMPFGGGGGMGYGGRGMGGQLAEPGTYIIKLTVGAKTYTGKVSVRLDPIQVGQQN
jgi:photosystem II stability/assembly factor-like uncharacterized protein